jgi:PAS domain S-box-containing protein
MPSAGDNGLVSTRGERQATAQLAAIVQSSHDAIIGKDLNGTITSWNPGAERLYGYRADEVIGQHSSLLPNSASRAAEAALLSRILAGEHIEMVRTRRNHKSGAVLDVSLSLSPIVDDAGAIVGMSSASRDISDLISAQGMYEGLLESAPDAMVCVDADGKIILINGQVERLFGYSRLELVGQYVEILVPPAFAPTHAPLRQGYTRNPAPRPMGGGDQLSARRKDGSIFPADISVSSVDLGGRMVVTAAIRDVSSRVANEVARHQSEVLFSQLAESVDLAIVLRTLDPPRFLYVGPGYEKVFGYDPTAAGEGPTELAGRVVAEDSELFLSEFAKVAETGTSARAEYRIVGPDGGIRWIRSTTTPVVDGDDGVRRCVTVAEDITEVKRAEVALRAAEEAQKANAAKNEFLSRMSHELRTPLNAVLGFAQLLELDELTDAQHAALKHILRGGRHLVALIDDVLDIAKIESDRLDLSLEAVLLSELLTETVAMMAPMAEAAQVRLSYRQGEGASQHVHGDSRRLRQVVLNLISNAIKYNRAGGWVEVRCELSTTTNLDIVVQDNGIGIPAEELPRLFTPFDRLGAQSSTVEGSGVGLALSHRLMTTMDGTLQATSEVGVGSIFTASIPLAPALPVPLELVTQAPAETGLGESGDVEAPALTLLYIEDNNSNIMLMQHLLGHRPGWSMITAKTGTTGLELATTRSPDLVLLDLHLPDVNGMDVLHRLRAEPRTSGLRVVIVSADANPNQMNRLLAAGAYAYLTKPLDVARMLTLLDNFSPESAESLA